MSCAPPWATYFIPGLKQLSGLNPIVQKEIEGTIKRGLGGDFEGGIIFKRVISY